MARSIKFEKLNQYFKELQEHEIILSFELLEKITGEKLPDSAYKYPAYWSPSKTHTITRCWLENGYKVAHLDLKEQTIIFRKIELPKDDFSKTELTSYKKKCALPNYMEDETNIALFRLCEDAGIKVIFTDDIPEYLLARSRDNIIQMRTEYNSYEDAGLILSHELAHSIIDNFYTENKFFNRENNRLLSTLIESDCDRAGAIIYSLAELIAAHEAEKIFL